ncbi:DUF4149 domain-containing protein [Helicobacter cynogastricus]|uniref:DUF4149 domain-containing protein n=1 Tax=Helicobacter cynogastricus TaxID=329937 RepID=UPI001F44164A|nr:DUF4149 domain-containing protein [Helicobacter cynogastricus]
MGVGIVFFAGAGVAPIIFKSGLLSQGDAGVLMGRIFVQANAFLNALGVLLGLDSLYLLLKRSRRALLALLGLLSVVLIALFSFYYTPHILHAQAIGETATQAFAQMHTQSEILFKILLVLLCAGFVGRVWRR